MLENIYMPVAESGRHGDNVAEQERCLAEKKFHLETKIYFWGG